MDRREHPLVVAVNRWAKARSAGEGDGRDAAQEELRESWPGFLEVLLVSAVFLGDFSLLGDGIPARSDPEVQRFLITLDDGYFNRLEHAGRVRLLEAQRARLTDILYGWVALRMRGPGQRLRRGKGRAREWGQEALIALLAGVYEDAGGRRSLSWGKDSETVVSPHADFLRLIWEILPQELTRRTSTETFVCRARKLHFFNRRFKDDIEHSQWLRREEEKKGKKRKRQRKLAKRT